jgi:Domain of unknown function (DUF4419)
MDLDDDETDIYNTYIFSNPVSNANELLSRARPKDYKVLDDHIFMTSFADLTAASNVYPAGNGFVDTVVHAYNEHQHLYIRADDVWFAVLGQFSIYVNEHAAEYAPLLNTSFLDIAPSATGYLGPRLTPVSRFRDIFFSHEGDEPLEINAAKLDIRPNGSKMRAVDRREFYFKMTKLMTEKIKDPILRDWILPSFTTTTRDDLTVTAVLMMATFQKYFSYGSVMKCGLPSVTLLGQKSDWDKLKVKAGRLKTFGEEPTVWHKLLKPVLSRFVSPFDIPKAPETIDFWQKIDRYSNGASGAPYLSVSYC